MTPRFSLLFSALLSAVMVSGCRSSLETHLATVGGRTVEYATAGDGSATVVFEAGLGNDLTAWDRVAAQVSQRARVFAYSRPGYGHSDSPTTPREPSHIAEELRTLLTAEGYSPHYVLVGHSFGGAYLEFFAKAHPAEVAAVVLLDPRHRDFSAACAAANLTGCGIPASAVVSLPQVQRDEYEGYDTASAQIRNAGSFGAYPVRVLISTEHGSGKGLETLWKSMLTSLAAEAADGQAIVFEGAGHNLEFERVDEVAQVIISVLPGESQSP